MRFKIQIVGGRPIFPKGFNEFCKEQKDGNFTVEIKKYVSTRTEAQNRSLHRYFTQLAEALNDAGFDMKKVIKIDVPWNSLMVKELLWRPVQKTYTGKESTTKLDKIKEIDMIYDIINRVVGERTGVYVPFPSYDNENY